MTRLVDDLDGSEALTTVSFSLDGSTYEIDLSESHLVALQEALAPYVTAARRRRARDAVETPKGTTPKPAVSKPATSKPAAPKRTPRQNGLPAPSHVPVNQPPFHQPSPVRGTASSARPKPDRAPLVADPFNPQAHRSR
jgi:Lsr2